MNLTWLWSVSLVPHCRELISQSAPLPDIVRMYLLQRHQFVSLKLRVSFACYRFNIFKLPHSCSLKPSHRLKMKGRSPCTTPRRAPAINHSCQSSCAPALWWELAPELNIVWSCDESTSFSPGTFDQRPWHEQAAMTWAGSNVTKVNLTVTSVT